MSLLGFKNWVVLSLIGLSIASSAFAGKEEDQKIYASKKRLRKSYQDLVHRAELYREFKNGKLPNLPLWEIAKYLFPADACSAKLVSKNWYREIKQGRKFLAQELVEEIETIMRKWGEPIALSEEVALNGEKGSKIEPAAPTQELWVKVMKNNPSHFKEKKYCPETHKIVVIDGNPIEMCRDFPVDNVVAQSAGRNDSDEEFICKLNQFYAEGGSDIRFRRQTRAEFNAADTENGRVPKGEDDPNLGEYTPYYQIPNQPAHFPSGERQPRPISQNRANALGFRRSGVWEWTQDMDGSSRGLVGGSWFNFPQGAASGFRFSFRPDDRHYFIGPSRLVRTQ